MAISVSKPPLLLRLNEVTVDLKKLFLKMTEAVTRAGVAYATGDWKGTATGLITSAFGAAEAASLETPPETLAWQLIRGGISRGIADLVSELRDGVGAIAQGDRNHLDRRIESEIGTADVEIDKTFFLNPAALPLLRSLEAIFADWLRFCDLSPEAANAMARRLPSYVAVGFHEEWRCAGGCYDGLLKAMDSPLAQAVEWEREWLRYQQKLIQAFDKPVFEERFPLSAIYVPLRAARREAVPRQSGAQRANAAPRSDEPEFQAIVVDLETEIRTWLERADLNDSLRIIRGGPGSGKSTSAKKIAADLARDGTMRVLLFPLQHFRMAGKLIDAIGEALGEYGYQAFRVNPLQQPDFATSTNRLLLIFDGLDELAQPGQDADKQTRDFLSEVRFFIDLWNVNSCRVLCLITGRSAIIQAHRDSLRRKDGQELEVLPLLIDTATGERWRRAGFSLLDPENLLAIDQRDLWWRNYATSKDGEPRAMPSVLLSNDVSDLSKEPLLLYLLVLSRYHRRDVSSLSVNRNSVYASLFADVADRRHAFGAALSVRHVLNNDFPEVIETIATAAWYGDGRTATVEDIRAICPKHIRESLERFLGSEQSLSRLVAAFYFQQHEPQARRRDAIEFTHKSFGEYLTARRIVRTIREIHADIAAGHRHYDLNNALEEWFTLTSRSPLDFDLLRFLRDEVALHAGEAGAWQSTLTDLLDLSLWKGMPLSPAGGESPRTAAARQRNANEALLAAVNSCARVTRQRTKLEFHSPTDAGGFIGILRRQRKWGPAGPFLAVPLDCLSFLDLSSQDLSAQDLIGGDITDSCLDEAWLVCTALAYSDLSRASLRMSNLQEALCHQSKFVEADLQEAVLRSADLRYADLTRANLSDADLSDANMLGANLSGAAAFRTSLSCAKLHGTNLSDADLSDANLGDATLSDANLSGAKLSNANLSGAYMACAQLPGADLSGADLSGADLSGANLSGADLSGANLSGANLTGADLSLANLCGANLSDTNPFLDKLFEAVMADLSKVQNDPNLPV
jgi:uncharacterized protein YjbI with pentapeptide repeats